MSRDVVISRRYLLSLGMGSGAALLARPLGAATPAAAGCQETPAQIEGPFYPTVRREDGDLDLTVIKGRPARAKGDVIHVRGQVLGDDCKPIAGAVVEIWQANTWGRYDHERDASNPKPLDPNFQGWGRVVTDADGRYGFKTIKPGSYPADDRGWIRPPHVHFKVLRRGYHELTTQMYFSGEALNEPDLLQKELSREERARVLVDFQSTADIEPGARVGSFDITLRRVV